MNGESLREWRKRKGVGYRPLTGFVDVLILQGALYGFGIAFIGLVPQLPLPFLIAAVLATVPGPDDLRGLLFRVLQVLEWPDTRPDRSAVDKFLGRT